MSLFSENSMIGSMWHDSSGRSRSLLLGLPAIFLAIVGLLLLLTAEFGVVASLEERYSQLAESSAQEKQELKQDLNQQLAMLKASNPTAKPSELIPKEDESRQAFEVARDQQRIYLEKLNSLNPDEPKYLFDLGKAFCEDGERNKGLAMIQKVSPRDQPGYLEGHLYLARVLLNEKVPTPQQARINLRAALDHLDHALTRDPENMVATNFKALILMRTGSPDDLEVAYELYEKLFEKDALAYSALIELNRRMGKLGRNDLILTRAIKRMSREFAEVDPTSDRRKKLRESLVSALGMQEKYTEAESLVQNEIQLYSQGDYEEETRLLEVKALMARVYLAWATKIQSDNPSDQQEQLDFLTKAYNNEDSNAAVQRLITRLSFSENEQIANAASAIYDATADPDRAPAVTNELGIQALARAQYDDALYWFDLALKKSGSTVDAEVLNNLAYAYLKVDPPRPEKSLQLIDKAFAASSRAGLEKFETNFRDTRARALMLLKNYDGAIADFRRALIGRPNNLGIMEAMIECFQLNNMQAEANVWSQKRDRLIRKQNENAPQEASESESVGK